jgi:hypothetical protein
MPLNTSNLSFSQIREFLNSYSGGYSSTNLSLASMSSTAYANNHDSGYNPGNLDGSTPHKMSELQGWYAKTVGSYSYSQDFYGSIEWNGSSLSTTGGFELGTPTVYYSYTGGDQYYLTSVGVSSLYPLWGPNGAYWVFVNGYGAGIVYSDSNGYMSDGFSCNIGPFPSTNVSLTIPWAPGGVGYDIFPGFINYGGGGQQGSYYGMPTGPYDYLVVGAYYPGETSAIYSNYGQFYPGSPASAPCGSNVTITGSGPTYY